MVYTVSINDHNRLALRHTGTEEISMPPAGRDYRTMRDYPVQVLQNHLQFDLPPLYASYINLLHPFD
jgi:hypothetical protein